MKYEKKKEKFVKASNPENNFCKKGLFFSPKIDK